MDLRAPEGFLGAMSEAPQSHGRNMSLQEKLNDLREQTGADRKLPGAWPVGGGQGGAPRHQHQM